MPRLLPGLVSGLALASVLVSSISRAEDAPSSSASSAPSATPSAPSAPSAPKKKKKPAAPPPTLATQSETAPASGHAACAAAPSGMSCVPGGPAIVGGVDEASSPARIVELSTFYIDQKEATGAQYDACVAAKVCPPAPSTKKAPDAPATLTWAQAKQYCVWAGKRLPTEWEWEKAARGPNGDVAFGHYATQAMGDGVSEWTATWFHPDTDACGPRCNDKDPQGPCDGANPCPKEWRKAVRGVSSSPKAALTPFARRGEAAEGVSKPGVRCASSSTALLTSPPKLLTEKRAPPPALSPPSAEQLKVFGAIDEDELAKQICEKKGRSFVDCRDPNHYVKSNEPRQYIWRPYIENLGGGYAGVGIDQNYSFMAHAKSEWAWLFDYDPTVVRLHFVLRAVILDSADRAAFLAHFKPEAKDSVLELLSKTYAGNPERAAYREIYAVSRASLYKYYEHQTEGRISIPDIVKAPTAPEDAPKRRAGVKVGEESADPTFGWLATEEAYQYIRTLYQQGRVHIMKGDMLAKNTMQGIGAAAKALNVPIRIYYPSNAPECWPWTEQYKKNVLALPFDDKTVVLQTLSGIKTGFGKQIGYWHHNVQSGLQQQDFARRRGVGSLKQAVQDRLPGNDPDVSTCGLLGS